jgi:hypothetical protein
MNYSAPMKAPVLPPDLREPRERAYRAFIAVLDAWIVTHDIERDPDAELLALTEQEIVSEAMRQVYRVLTGGAERVDRLDYLRKVPAPEPAWKQAAKFALSLAGRRQHYRPSALFRPDRDICVFHNSAITAAYAKQRGLEPCLMTHGDWFSPAPDAAKRGASFNSSIERMLKQAMREAFVATGLKDEGVIAHSVARFSSYARWIDHHRSALERSGRKLPKEFWAATMGFPLHRILARAVLSNGGTVVGFDHGAGSGMYAWDYPARTEFSMLSRFVTFAPAMADGLRRNVESCRGRFRSVEIEVLAEPQRRIALSFRPSAKNPIAYISRSYWGENFTSPPLDDNERLKDWQWRLLPALKALGREVEFKPHPEDIDTPAEQFRDVLGVTFRNGKFEGADWSDTILVFDTTLSSTFPYALATGLPIIVFDTPHVQMRPEARALLERRVAMAPVWRDAETRLQADWNKLPELIEQAIARRDNALLKTYYGIELEQ